MKIEMTEHTVGVILKLFHEKMESSLYTENNIMDRHYKRGFETFLKGLDKYDSHKIRLEKIKEDGANT